MAKSTRSQRPAHPPARRSGGANRANRGPARPGGAARGGGGRGGSGGGRGGGTGAGRGPWVRVGLPGLVVLVAVVVLVVVATAGGGSKPPASTGPDRLAAPAAVVSDLTGVPAPVFDQVGVPSGVFGPTKIPNGKALTSGGKPSVVFVGDEWCPICATDRWPLAVALARFGTFSHLSLTRSSPSDSYANTNTLSFAGASYTSPYLVYQPVEIQTRDRKPLETPSALQLSLVTGIGHDSVPVIDFGGRYLMNGASYDPAALADKTWQQIAGALVSPTDDAGRTIQRDVLGTANLYTAAICSATGGQPAAVCSSTGVKVATAALTSSG